MKWMFEQQDLQIVVLKIKQFCEFYTHLIARYYFNWVNIKLTKCKVP